MENNNATIASKFKVLVLLVIVATLSLGVYMYKGVEVSLELDGEEFHIVSYEETVKEFIKREDIDLKAGAYINVPLDANLEDNPNIIIKNLKTYRIFQKTEKSGFRAFMVVQGLRICLPMQDIQVPFLVGEIPHASGQLSQ